MVSVQQASANALAAWLRTQITGVTIFSRWPNTDVKLPERVLSITTSGRRRDIPIQPTILSNTPNGDTNTDTVWLVAACVQPLQLDVWTRTHQDRDDLVAQLDVLLRAGTAALAPDVDNPFTNPIGIESGVLVTLGDNWPDTIADIEFADPELEEAGDQASAADFRATYRGNANVMLSVATTTARQKVITFQQRVATADSNYQDF